MAAHKKSITKDDSQFIRTAENLFRKGKTNKKLHGKHANPMAAKYDRGVQK